MAQLSEELRKLILGAIGDPSSALELIAAIENGGVSSLSGLIGALNLVAGSGISITPLGNNLTITNTGPGSGTVTSVAFTDSSLPAPIYSVMGSPITSNGTLSISLVPQPKNTAFLGPKVGANAPPYFRAIEPDDFVLGGTNNQVLGTNGSGAFFWASPVMAGGNALGSTLVIGTTDAEEFDLITSNTTRLAIDAVGDIGIGNTPQTGTKLVIFAQDLTPNLTRGEMVVARSLTTSNNSNNTFGLQSNAAVQVDAGVSNSAINAGIIGFGERGNVAADAGSVAGLVGLVAGIDIEDTDAAATTNLAAAIAIQNTVTSGSVTDMYDIYVLPGTETGSTITNHYGLFINPDDVGTKINYLTGLTEFGGIYAAPTSVVEINGDLGLNGSISGKVTIEAAATTASYDLTMPAAQGAVGTVLTNSDGAGTLTWAAAGGGGGAPMTNWVAYTPLYTTGDGQGANLVLTGQYRRVGDSIDIRTLLSFTGAPTFTRLQISIPAGLTVDTSKILDTVSMTVGQVTILKNGVADYSGQARYNSTTDFVVSVDKVGGETYAHQVDVNFLTPVTFAPADTVDVLITSLPITQYAF